jgi:hypothetical protein
MAPVLSYEVPAHVEFRFLSPRMVKGMSAGAVGLVLLGLALPVVLHHVTRGWTSALWTSAGPTIGAVTLVLCVAVHGQTQVFADRLEVSLHWAGVRVWRRRVPWADVVRYDVRHKRPVDTGFKMLGLGPGLTVVMFGGDGVSLHLKGFAELLVGSADPDTLAAAIEAARSAEPAAEPLGSDGH